MSGCRRFRLGSTVVGGLVECVRGRHSPGHRRDDNGEHRTVLDNLTAPPRRNPDSAARGMSNPRGITPSDDERLRLSTICGRGCPWRCRNLGMPEPHDQSQRNERTRWSRRVRERPAELGNNLENVEDLRRHGGSTQPAAFVSEQRQLTGCICADCVERCGVA